MSHRPFKSAGAKMETRKVPSQESSFESFRPNPFQGEYSDGWCSAETAHAGKKAVKFPFLSPLYSFNALERLCLAQLSEEKANALGCGCRCSMWEISHHGPRPKQWTEIEIETSTVLKFPYLLDQAALFPLQCAHGTSPSTCSVPVAWMHNMKLRVHHGIWGTSA